MKFTFTSIGYCILALVSAGMMSTAYAATSTSFNLYDNLAETFNGESGVGSRYSIANTANTDNEGIGSRFQVLAGVSTSTTTTPSTTTSTDGGSSGNSSGGGGRRKGNSEDSTDKNLLRIEDPFFALEIRQEELTASLQREISIHHTVIAQEALEKDQVTVSAIDSIPPHRFVREVHNSAPELYVNIADTPSVPEIAILVIFLLFLCSALLGIFYQRCKKKERVLVFATAVLCISLVCLLLSISVAQAKTTTPLMHVYHGNLYDSNQNPITTEHTIRFSYWNSSDYVSGDITGTGAVNTSSTNFIGWFEEHTVLPNSKGFFHVKLGSIVPLPSFETLETSSLLDLFLQVEVKESSEDDTSYDLLDYDTTDETSDRRATLSSPFSSNADLLDQHDTGTSSGSIPVLLTGGLLPTSTIPGETNADILTIDADGSVSSGSVTLTFGSSLAKTLSYSTSSASFEFNDDVSITGDLTVSGLINGVDLSAITSSSDTHLKVSSGAGLTISVAAGSYRINGTVTNYSGNSGIAVADDTTNYVFFTSSGLTVNATGFTDSGSMIRLAEVVTVSGGVSTVTDRRVLQSDDREHDIKKTIHAEYEHATYQGDATSNVGQLSVSHDSITQQNYYLWDSTSTSLQDYDVVLPVALPDDFTSWDASAPITVTYRSTSADSTDNKLDISVFDTNGSPITLSGSTTDLSGTSWATTTVDFIGSPTWTAGQNLLIKLKMSAKDSYQMHLSDINLQFSTFEE